MKRNEENVNYDDYKYKSYLWKEDGRHLKPSKKRKEKQKKFSEKKHVVKADKQAVFVVLTLIVCFSLTFVAATVSGKGSVMNFLKKDKTEKNGKRFYVVCSDEFSDESLARISADEARASGGAGYIIYDKKYYLALACYARRDDAEKVLKRLSKSGASIYEIKIGEPSLLWCDSSESACVKSALGYVDTAFSKLYETTVSFDGGNISEIEVKDNLQSLSSEITALSCEIDGLLKKHKTPELIKIKAEIKATAAVIDNVCSSEYKNAYLSAAMRFATLSIVTGYKNLATEL